MEKDRELKKKLVKKGVAVLLASTMIGTVFTGCAKKSLLEETILDGTEIVYVDDQPLIMSYFYPRGAKCAGKHYKDIVSGKIYHIKNENNDDNEVCHYNDINTLSSETKIEPITPYLTSEEIEKAKDGKFTDADAIAIEQRITNESKTMG